jgi:hypothetical protein
MGNWLLAALSMSIAPDSTEHPEDHFMSSSDENSTVRQAADTVVEYEGAFESYIKDRPLAAVAVSFVIGALLAKFLF